ncbi:hypothetical protein [Caballeronia sp. SEWSISQ10-4 2]|nr:hypothetical protein [Caballeronia sp. SEWSISQ10-4 2]
MTCKRDGEMSGRFDTPDVIAVALDRRGFILLNPESPRQSFDA